MANTFQGVLANIPGLAGYLAGAANDQSMQGGQLQQLSQLSSLYNGIQSRNREAAFRNEVSGAQTPEERLAIAQKFMGAGDLGKSLQSSSDRQALIQSKSIEAENARQQRIWEMGQKFDQELEKIRVAADEKRISAEEASRREQTMRESMARLAASLRQPVAPTVKDLVDPSDPTRMISVDVRQYRGGGLGSPGVIGVAGKEPTAAKRTEKEAQGKELLSSELDNLSEYYKQLNEAKAIPSNERGGVSNIASSIQSSGVGQFGGRVLGTKEQTARDNIQSSRLRLLNAIKGATGMSAQQLNSNVELQTWLSSLTDPSRSYESNLEIIDKIKKSFLGGQTTKPGTPVDALLEKYK